MSGLNKIFPKIIIAFTIAGGICLLGVMLLTVANIVGRLFGKSIGPTFELTSLVIVISAMFAIVYAALQKAHIVIDVLTTRMSERAKEILEVFTNIISLMIVAILTWGSLNMFIWRWEKPEETALLHLTMVPFRLILMFGFVLFFLVLLFNTFGKKR